jgi:maltodextrin utilization protein YvdJ
MVRLLQRILLTMIALAAVVLVGQSFGTVTAMVVAGIGFLLYVLWVTLRQMRDEDETE